MMTKMSEILVNGPRDLKWLWNDSVSYLLDTGKAGYGTGCSLIWVYMLYKNILDSSNVEASTWLFRFELGALVEIVGYSFHMHPE